MKILLQILILIPILTLILNINLMDCTGIEMYPQLLYDNQAVLIPTVYYYTELMLNYISLYYIALRAINRDSNNTRTPEQPMDNQCAQDTID